MILEIWWWWWNFIVEIWWWRCFIIVRNLIGISDMGLYRKMGALWEKMIVDKNFHFWLNFMVVTFLEYRRPKRMLQEGSHFTLDRFVQKSKKIMFSGPTSFNMIQTFIFGIRNEEEYLYAYFHNQKRRLKRRLVVPGVRKPSQKLSKF